jgi:hypothetical protein
VRARVVERTAHARPRRRGPLGHSSSLALVRALDVSRAALRCVGLAVLLGIGLIRGRAAERRRERIYTARLACCSRRALAGRPGIATPRNYKRFPDSCREV